MSSKNTNDRLCVILNPKAGAGAAGKKQDQLKHGLDAFFTSWEIRETEGPKHATELASLAAQEGFDIIAAVGGDGTCHEVINGMLRDDRLKNSGSSFGLIPLGTGSDLRRTLKIPTNMNEALRILSQSEARKSDIGKCTLLGKSPATEYFINVAGFGANGEVAQKTNQGSKKMGGKLTFLGASIHTIFSYKAPQIKLNWTSSDDSGEWEGKLLSCFVANASYCGGGMLIGPNASMHDGLADIGLLPKMSKFDQLLEIRKLYNGQIDKIKGSFCQRVSELCATTTIGNNVLIELDGEIFGKLPANFSIVKEILPIRANWKATDSN